MKIPVLVVGGAGYIGSHCAKALADAGYHPVCFDNLTAGHREFVKWGPLIEGDIFDSALAGRVATIASVERDLEDRVHYAVTIDDDPGRDLGAAGWPGHRFFSPEEVEPA